MALLLLDRAKRTYIAAAGAKLPVRFTPTSAGSDSLVEGRAEYRADMLPQQTRKLRTGTRRAAVTGEHIQRVPASRRHSRTWHALGWLRNGLRACFRPGA